MVAVRGIPDFLMCVNGQFVALELKKDQSEQADWLQQYHIAEITKAGGWATIVSPETWDQVYSILCRMARGELSLKLQPGSTEAFIVN